MSLTNLMFQQLYQDYRFSLEQLAYITDIDSLRLKRKILDADQEQCFEEFYYGIELLHSILENNSRDQTGDWFMSCFDYDIPFMPCDIYKTHGAKEVHAMILSGDCTDYVRTKFPECIKKAWKIRTEKQFPEPVAS